MRLWLAEGPGVYLTGRLVIQAETIDDRDRLFDLLKKENKWMVKRKEWEFEEITQSTEFIRIIDNGDY